MSVKATMRKIAATMMTGERSIEMDRNITRLDTSMTGVRTAMRSSMSGVLEHVNTDDVLLCTSPESAIATAASGIAYAVMPAVPRVDALGICAVPVDGLPKTTFGLRMRRGKRAPYIDTFFQLLSKSVGK